MKDSLFLTNENLVLREFNTEQIRQVIKSSLAAHMNTVKDVQIRELLSYIFCERHFSVTLLNKTQFLHFALVNSQAKVQTPCKMSVLIAFEEQLYFHTKALISRGAGRGTSSEARGVARWQSWWFRLYRRLWLRSRCIVYFGHYRLCCSLPCDSVPCCYNFRYFSSDQTASCPRYSKERFFEAETPLLQLDGVDATSRSGSPDVYEAIRFLFNSMYGNLTKVMFCNSLYIVRNE